MGEVTTWVHDRKGVDKVVRQDFNIRSHDLSYDWVKATTCKMKVVWVVRNREKLSQWVRLTVLVVMNSFKPKMNNQLMR